MSAKTRNSLLIFAIVLIAGSAAAFLIVEDKDAIFWISYGFAVLGLCMTTFGGWLTAGDTDHPAGYFSSTASGIYFAAVLAVILFFAIILEIPMGWYLAIHILLLAIFLVTGIIGNSGTKYIEAQDKVTGAQVLKARMDTLRVTSLIDSVEDLPAEMQAEVKKALIQVEEKLRYSDPVTSPATASYAMEVDQALDTLEDIYDSLTSGGDANRLLQQSKVCIRKIDAYNRAKLLSK